MKIVAVLNVHSNSELIIDTVDSILHYMTDKIFMVIDGAAWNDLKDICPEAHKIQGFYHGVPKAPYRNVALAISQAYENERADWYCYLEQDVLITSDRFRNNLVTASQKDVWLLGNNGHVDGRTIPVMDYILNEECSKKNSYYLLGCCQFMNKSFLDKLSEYDYLKRFLELTNGLPPGELPGYTGYDVSEHMYPTLVRYFKKQIGVFATWDYVKNKWHGHGQYFPMRWQPELNHMTDNFPEASIMHPLKVLDNPIRVNQRKKRQLEREVKNESR